ncbi:MAG: 2Fe-2S iron-sulfur cluster-binding protein [Prochloraceae cyanobacterium]|nr:2Fe-2S iron-sulfur cluster-binding protein [Prochloraceae cyanobacterium]
MAIKIRFLPDDITIDAEPGESMLEVAERAGVFIPTGCLMGSCHACEVELDDGSSICACITAIPDDKKHITINLESDLVW